MGKYEPNKHEKEPIKCPRPKCGRKNAPVESDSFSPRCWKCNAFLNVTPVNPGDEVVLDVEDIHENGSGVGKTDDGYVVLVPGVLPPDRVKAEIKEVKPNYSKAELVEKVDQNQNNDDNNTVKEDEGNTEEDDEKPSLGSRENYWG